MIPQKRTRVRSVLLLGAFIVSLATERVWGTWSIILVDTRTKEVAIGAATCFAIDLTTTNPVMLVELGGAISQHQPDYTGKKRRLIHQELRRGTPPDQIIELVTQLSLDFRLNSQFGIVDMLGRVSNYTGSQVHSFSVWAGALSGQTGTLVYSIQGNLLTGEPVLQRAENAVLTSAGDLAEKLMAGMEAARSMGGDGRCSCGPGLTTSCGSPPSSFSKSAHVGYMMLSRPADRDGDCTPTGCATGDYYMKFNVNTVTKADPVNQLRALFDNWRQELQGRPDAVQSQVEIAPRSLSADGKSKAVMTISLLDWRRTPVTAKIASLTVEHEPGTAPVTTIGPVKDLGEGRYSVELTAGERGGVDRFRIIVNDGMKPVRLAPSPSLRVAGDLHFAQFGDGQGISSSLILLNPSPTQTATGKAQLFNSNGTPLTVEMNGAVRKGSFDFNLPPKGVGFYVTGGSASLVAGSAQINSSIPIDGTILFSGGFGVAGVGPTPLAKKFLVPIESDRSRGVDTGVAIYNPAASEVQITLDLRDGEGILSPNGRVSFLLPAKGQLARFTHELYEKSEINFSQFRGTLEVNSSAPLSGMAIRTSPGEFATLPVTRPQEGARDLYFAQFGDGQGISSTLMIINPSPTETARGEVNLFRSDGKPLTVDINGTVETGGFLFRIPPQGVGFYSTDGQGDQVTGSVHVRADIPIGGGILFSGGFGVAGVGAMQPVRNFLVPIDSDDSRGVQTGIALANPLNSEVMVSLELRNADGTLMPKGSVSVSLGPKGQLAKFPLELYPSSGIAFSRFRGVLEVNSDVELMGMAIRVSPGQFATLPVTPGN